MLRSLLHGIVAVSLCTAIVGCGQPANKSPSKPNFPSAASSAVAKAAKDEEHGHKPGAHGGILVTIGADNYHAEAVFEKGGTLRLYMLGRDETKVAEVETQTLTGFVKAEGDVESVSFEIRPEPQSDDAAGKTSLFVGKLPKECVGKSLTITVPKLRIGGDRFRLGFTSAPVQTHQEGMPEKVTDDEGRQIYLMPGGKYSAADIKANGNVTASQKFAGAMAKHDMKPKLGEKICPITKTKANPKFTWIVGGKPYEFCCPPCIDEFVKLAKESPAEIKEPGEYVKK